MTKFAFAAAIAASLSCLAAPAMAEGVSVNVAYGDLDISSPAGAQVFAQRLEAGVDTACARPDLRDVKSMSVFEACKSTAVADAAQQLSRAGETPAIALK